MFFCEKCRNRNDWPDSYFKSHGKCEVCRKVADCNNVPSKYLPTRVDSGPGRVLD